MGREAPRLPHPARPVCPPHAPRPRGDTVSPPRVWPPARHRAAYPRPSWCAHPARLSPSRPPALPATWSLRGLGPRVPRGGGAELPPRAPPSPAPFTRPPVATARPPARSLRRVSGWGGGGGGGGSLRGPFARPPAHPSPSRRRPWTGSPAGRSSALRSGPSAPSACALYLPVLASPGAASSSSSSVGRPSGSLWLPLCRPPPRVCPLPARPPVPVEASLPPSVARRGPGTRVRGKGPRGGRWVVVGFRSRKERAASGRERGVGVEEVGPRPVSRGHGGWGRRRAVAVVSRAAVGPAPGRGPRVTGRVAPRPARAAAGGRGRRACGPVCRGGVERGGAPAAPTPRLARLPLSRYLARPGAEV